MEFWRLPACKSLPLGNDSFFQGQDNKRTASNVRNNHIYMNIEASNHSNFDQIVQISVTNRNPFQKDLTLQELKPHEGNYYPENTFVLVIVVYHPHHSACIINNIQYLKYLNSEISTNVQG